MFLRYTSMKNKKLNTKDKIFLVGSALWGLLIFITIMAIISISASEVELEWYETLAALLIVPAEVIAGLYILGGTEDKSQGD